MKKTPYYQVLVTAFRGLPEKHRDRLRKHAELRTPIAHGDTARFFFMNGAG